MSMYQNIKNGYTLLELIVSVGVFSLVMVVVSTAYLTLVDLDRKGRSTTAVVTNLSFAVDSMARAIRTGQNYSCNFGTNCPSGASRLSFIDENGRTITYTLSNGVVMRECSGSGCPVAGAVPLTDASVTVSTLTFRVTGVGTGDGLQPRVTFSMRGVMSAGPKQSSSEFTLQGGATQRIIEL